MSRNPCFLSLAMFSFLVSSCSTETWMEDESIFFLDIRVTDDIAELVLDESSPAILMATVGDQEPVFAAILCREDGGAVHGRRAGGNEVHTVDDEFETSIAATIEECDVSVGLSFSFHGAGPVTGCEADVDEVTAPAGPLGIEFGAEVSPEQQQCRVGYATALSNTVQAGPELPTPILVRPTVEDLSID